MNNFSIQYVNLYYIRRRNMSELTERERLILLYITQGLNNAEIGNKLNISKHTVKAHVSTIIQKMCAKSRSELAYMAGKSNMF